MQNPSRLPSTMQLKNVSNTVGSPVKMKIKTAAPCLAAPKTPPRPQTNSFITSSPASGKRSVPSVDRKQRLKLRTPRTPSGTLFSPTYPPAVGVSQFQLREPATPTSELSPVQKSLHENVARYGHLAQEFDSYDCEDFDPYRFIASLPEVSYTTPKTSLPPRCPDTPLLTLVLDLDETLVHCSTDSAEIKNPDFVFQVEFQGTIYTVNCKKRPGLDEFLEYIKNRFEVVVFTASQRVYADKLLDILDPTREIIHHRMFREDCTNVEGNYLKDLSVLGRDLRAAVIVDNSPQAFALQLDNGIPILSWFDSKHDRELFKVISLLEQLVDIGDVRPLLRERFRLHLRVESYGQMSHDDIIESFEQRLAESLEAVA